MAFGALKGTLVGNGNSITASNALTNAGIVVAIGDLVFGVLGEQTSLTAAGTVTDNLGNTYAYQNAGTLSGTAVSGRPFWGRVTNAGTLTQINVPATASTHDFAGAAEVIEGPIQSSPLDANPANITTDVSSPFTCPTTGTLNAANEIVVCWGVANQSTVWAATSPNLLGTNVANSTNVKVAIGYQAVAVTTAVVPAFTAAANPTAAVLGTASFKALINLSTAESMSLADTPSATASFQVSAAESMSLADTPSATASFQVSQSESIALADTPSATAAFGVSQSEAIALADTPSATLEAAGPTSEAMSLADTPSATAVLNDTTAEAIALVDTPSATASVGVSTDETITFADTPSVTTDWAVSTSEAIALADTPSAVTDFAVSASEVIALADTPSATAVYNVSVSESINLVDTSIGDSGNDATSAESISLTDTPSATASFVASVSESITFTDTCDAEVVPAGDITGDVETGQVQECDGTANITQRSRFGGGGTGELPEWHSVYEFIEATVSTGQSQSTVADAEVIEPPAITATIKTGSRPGATRARLSLIDPVELSISTGQGQWCSAGNIETEYEVEVTTGSANQSAATGEMDQWTEDEIAAVILLLAA